MRNFKMVIRRLRLSIRNRIAKRANARPSNHINNCQWDSSAYKLAMRLPDNGWRLIDRIHISTCAGTEKWHHAELEEELLERIDFFACLFGSRKIE